MVKLHFDLFKIRWIAAQLSMDLKKNWDIEAFTIKKLFILTQNTIKLNHTDANHKTISQNYYAEYPAVLLLRDWLIYETDLDHVVFLTRKLHMRKDLNKVVFFREKHFPHFE